MNCVFFQRVRRHAVFAVSCTICEFDHDVVAYSLEIPIAPVLEWKRFRRRVSGGVGVDFVGRTEYYVYPSAIGLPPGGSPGEMLVGVSDTPVVLFLVLVFDAVGRGIAPQPELLDKLFALVVGVQTFEGAALLLSDDVDDVFVKPLLLRGIQFLLERGFFLHAVTVAWFLQLRG